MKLSVININHKNKAGLIKTVESVIQWISQDFESIFIVGGRIYGSKEYIEQMQGHFDYWVFKKDKGIYNAIKN